MNKRLSLIITIICAALVSPTYAKDIRPVFNAGVDFFNVDNYLEETYGEGLAADDSLSLIKIGLGLEGRINHQFKLAGLFNYGFESTNGNVTLRNRLSYDTIFIKNLTQFQVKLTFEPMEEIYLFVAPTYSSVEYQVEYYMNYTPYTLSKKESDMGAAFGGGLNVSKNVSLEAQIARISSDVSQFGLTASFKF